MERVADAVGSWVADGLALDSERREVLVYGALTLLQNGATVAAVLGLGALAGVLPEAAVAGLTAAVLRHASGGRHLSTPLRCLVFTAVQFLLCGLIGSAGAAGLAAWPLAVRSAVVSAGALAGLWVLYRRAPVPAEQRPLSEAYQAYLRRLSLVLGPAACGVLVLGAAAGSWWTISALAGFAVQAFSLTSAGQQVVHAIDAACDLILRREVTE